MRILIAGCGYVGTALAGQLAASGHEVFALRRRPSELPEGVQTIVADLTDPASLANLPDSLGVIYYTASASGYGEAAYRAAYLDGVANLLAALKNQRPRRFFFTSSTGVYGQDDGAWLDESSPPSADRPTAQALRDGEAEVLGGPIPGTVVRFSGIYGPGRTRLIDSVADGTARREQGATRYLNHIHRDDCAGVLAHLMGLEEPADLYLATDSEPRPRNDLLVWIAEAMGKPAPPFAEESGAAAKASERGGNRRYRNGRLLESGYEFIYPTFREGYGALIAARKSE